MELKRGISSHGIHLKMKATHELNGHGMPVLDFGPYDGDINGLVAESCGLTNDGDPSYMGIHGYSPIRSRIRQDSYLWRW